MSAESTSVSSLQARQRGASHAGGSEEALTESQGELTTRGCGQSGARAAGSSFVTGLFSLTGSASWPGGQVEDRYLGSEKQEAVANARAAATAGPAAQESEPLVSRRGEKLYRGH